jgi:hypothetical protein
MYPQSHDTIPSKQSSERDFATSVNVEAVRVCFGESFEALAEGIESALWQFGGVPQTHRTDHLGAAIHPLSRDEQEASSIALPNDFSIQLHPIVAALLPTLEQIRNERVQDTATDHFRAWCSFRKRVSLYIVLDSLTSHAQGTSDNTDLCVWDTNHHSLPPFVALFPPLRSGMLQLMTTLQCFGRICDGGRPGMGTTQCGGATTQPRT